MNKEQYNNKIDDLINKLQEAKNKKTDSSSFIKALRVFFYKQVIEVDKNIDRLIKMFFYLCIIGGVFFATYNFGHDIYKFCKGSDHNQIEINSEISKQSKNNYTCCSKVSLNQGVEKTVKSKKELSNEHDLELLKFIEHIFIYLIPLLIFLGLYFYYIINFSHHFTGAKTHSEKLIERAKSSIQLTKTLFLSSMMAYVVIKIIEKLFLTESDLKIEKLIAYGVFLFLLMFYLIFSHRRKD